MKIRFNKSALQEALSLVISVIPSRTPKPILQCLRITANEEGVRLSGTDLEVGINCLVAQVEVSEPGEVVLPADRVAAIVRESVDEVIEFESEDATIHIRGRDSHFTIYGHDLGQYPQIPESDGTSDLEISLGSLQRGIELTLFSTAKESTRYAINGVLWEVNEDILTMVGTDGRRLARALMPLSDTPSEALASRGIIVPGKTMALLDKISGNTNEKVVIKLVDNQILFTCGHIDICSNLVEGNFPKYEDIIPKDYTKSVTLSTAQTLSAVRRAALLISEDSKGIKVAVGQGVMVFSSRAPETGDAQIDMEVEYDGEPIEVGFNPQFLIDVLKVIKGDQFVLELGNKDRPGKIRAGEDYIYIVMPVSLG